MPHYLYFFHPKRPTFAEDMTADELAALEAHGEYLQAALERGELVLSGRVMGEPPRGIAIFKADSDEAARVFLENDPGVTAGVANVEFCPFYLGKLATDPSVR
jgi:uncharacterized protein YciI